MAWANFVDKTADINDSANYVQGSLQKDMPDSNQIGDYWKSMHPQWLEVADSYVPPAPPLTKSQQYATINERYDTTKAKLLSTIAFNDSLGLTEASTKLRAYLANSEAQRKTELLAVSNNA